MILLLSYEMCDGGLCPVDRFSFWSLFHFATSNKLRKFVNQILQREKYRIRLDFISENIFI